MNKYYKQMKIHKLVSFSRNYMISPKDRGSRDSLLYWRQTIFVSLLLTILTLGLFASLSGAFQFLKEENLPMAIVVILYYLIFFIIAFVRTISYQIRIMFLDISLYIIGISLLISTGPFGAGLLYLCASYIYLSINISRKHFFLFSILNIFSLLLLSFFYQTGYLDEYRISEYGSTWWIILINLIFINIFITRMVGIFLYGMERRFIKERRANKTLRRMRDRNNKQIRLLKSLRQIGNCLSDKRLEMSERLNILLKNLHTELSIDACALTFVNRNTGDSSYLSSSPDTPINGPFPIPSFSGPYLMRDHQNRRDLKDSTAMMRQLKQGQIYFGSHFYSAEQKGFLELLLKEQPDPSELEYIQMNLFQLSGAITNEQLFHQLEESRDTLELSYDEILKAWAKILELRDIETKGHSHRVVDLSVNLAKLLELSEKEIIHLQRGAFLHDIGKLGIPDSILHKEGPLNTEEWDIMRKHPQIGKESVQNIPFLKPALDVIYHHHEHWDGSGYPAGLEAEAIPLTARIFTHADVFDALISDRPYRRALTKKDAIASMISEKGQIFDPEILDIFIKNIEIIITDT